VEAPRKHGPFDTRWPCARKHRSVEIPTVPSLRTEEAAEALDWDAFSNRYFADRRRHDSEPRSAYLAYTEGREWRTTPPRLTLVPGEPSAPPVERQPDEAGTRRLLAAMAARRGTEV
jgi:hypothetical protein